MKRGRESGKMLCKKNNTIRQISRSVEERETNRQTDRQRERERDRQTKEDEAE